MSLLDREGKQPETLLWNTKFQATASHHLFIPKETFILLRSRERWKPISDEGCKVMSDNIKLEIFIPETHFPQLQKAPQYVDDVHIGRYDSWLSYSPVVGIWRPLVGTRPFIGEEGKVSCEPELKKEVTIKAETWLKPYIHIRNL